MSDSGKFRGTCPAHRPSLPTIPSRTYDIHLRGRRYKNLHEPRRTGRRGALHSRVQLHPDRKDNQSRFLPRSPSSEPIPSRIHGDKKSYVEEGVTDARPLVGLFVVFLSEIQTRACSDVEVTGPMRFSSSSSLLVALVALVVSSHQRWLPSSPGNSHHRGSRLRHFGRSWLPPRPKDAQRLHPLSTLHCRSIAVPLQFHCSSIAVSFHYFIPLLNDKLAELIVVHLPADVLPGVLGHGLDAQPRHFEQRHVFKLLSRFQVLQQHRIL